METQLIQIQQKYGVMEEELSSTNKKLAKAEKQLKEVQLREQ